MSHWISWECFLQVSLSGPVPPKLQSKSYSSSIEVHISHPSTLSHLIKQLNTNYTYSFHTAYVTVTERYQASIEFFKTRKPLSFGTSMIGSTRIQNLLRFLWITNSRGDRKWKYRSVRINTICHCDISVWFWLLILEPWTINFPACFLFVENTMILSQLMIISITNISCTFSMIETKFSCNQHLCLCANWRLLSFFLNSWFTNAVDISL